MDIGYFFNILWRSKWLILSVVLISSVAAWLLVGKRPPVYKSSAVISTGIVKFKGKTLSGSVGYIQKYEIESAFSQLMEDMKLPQVIEMLSDTLIKHDYQRIGYNTAPFRQPNYEDLGMSEEEVNDIATATLVNNVEDSLELQTKQEIEQRQLLGALGYDYKSLVESLEMGRRGDTDYLEMSFSSEKPELSYFALKNYMSMFMKTYGRDLSEEDERKMKFYREQTSLKKALLDSILYEINTYMSNNNIIDVSTQSDAIISQISDLEKRKNEEDSKLLPLRSSIKALSEKIYRYNNTYAEYLSSDRLNRKDFAEVDGKIKRAQQKILRSKGDKKKQYEDQLVKLRADRNGLVASLVAKNADDKHPWHDQIQNWVSDKFDNEIEYGFVKEAVQKYDKEVSRLRGKLARLAHSDEVLRDLLVEKEQAQKEYLVVKSELETINLKAASTDNPLEIIKAAKRPEKPESSLRPIIAVFSGIAGGTLTSILIFLLAFFDTTVQSPSQFKSQMKLPFLGVVNRVNMPSLNLYYLFHTPNPKKELASFRESIRKLRSAIETSGEQSFLFVSPKPEEGKSFLIILIAYALSLNNKRILIIDTNFRNNTLSNFKDSLEWNLKDDKSKMASNSNSNSLDSDQKIIGTQPEDSTEELHLKNIDIIGNKQSMQSPSEVLAGKDFACTIESYKAKYDYVFFEAASMNNYSDAAELAPFADKVIGVFSADSPLGNVDNETIEALRQSGGKFLGGVLNNVDLKNI
ncbi:MAG: succinoglycan biosynthesis transport protein ExoP [Paraglaciecola sp.]|jgi:succinoglycan biosynthesis transport protein ExoP